MEWLTTLISGILQGISEFLPISSSAHLLIFDRLLDLETAFEFYVLVNIGTLAALISFNRHLLLDIVGQCRSGSFALAARLFVSTLPAGILGFFLADFFQLLNGNLYLLVAMLMLVGLLMLPRPPKPQKSASDFKDLPWRHVLAIGGAQSLALIAGTSRSGITILSALWLGLKQDMAVTWSFLLAIPITGGAILRVAFSSQALELVEQQLALVVFVNIVSFVVGLLAIRLLLNVVRRHSLRPFGIYRLVLGLTLLGLLAGDVL